MSDRSSLADLEITVSTDEASATSAVSASPPLPTRSFALVEVPADGPQASTGSLAGEAAQPSEAPRGHFGFEDFLAATALEELCALRLGPFGRLARGLRPVGPWTPEGRIAPAYRAGLSAGALYSSPSLGIRNRYDIALQCVAVPAGFATQSVSRPTCSGIATGIWSRTTFATSSLLDPRRRP